MRLVVFHVEGEPTPINPSNVTFFQKFEDGCRIHFTGPTALIVDEDVATVGRRMAD